MHFFFRIIAPLVVISFLNCSYSDNNVVAEIPTQTTKEAIDKTLLLELVNNLRISGCKCGNKSYPPVEKLVWNTTLESVSLSHSRDMAQKNYFSHTAKDGSRTSERLERANYDWMSYGENIYRTSGYTATETEVIQAWKNSPGHCTNLMGRQFKEMGIAKYNNYWTQVFASPMPK